MLHLVNFMMTLCYSTFIALHCLLERWFSDQHHHHYHQRIFLEIQIVQLYSSQNQKLQMLTPAICFFFFLTSLPDDSNAHLRMFFVCLFFNPQLFFYIFSSNTCCYLYWDSSLYPFSRSPLSRKINQIQIQCSLWMIEQESAILYFKCSMIYTRNVLLKIQIHVNFIFSHRTDKIDGSSLLLICNFKPTT